ncbi:MAG: Bax inhibitor-1/YccA family protein [Alphaproteobacteria bacterium]|nr:Bax inhibitor-1/YccA family protein [Alphaproteobacteria bacterium]
MFETKEIAQSASVEMIDEGLRSYMIKVFNYMGLGLCVTALSAYLVANTPLIGLMYNIDQATRTVSLSGLGYLIIFAPLLMIFAFQAVITRGSVFATQAMFWAFSAIMGMSLSNILMAYTAGSIARVFLITAATFGTMSLIGYTTKKDLTSIGSFLRMGVWGLIIASIVNIFMHSAPLMYAISYISVAVFTGLTAYDVQNIKNMYYHVSVSGEFAKKAAVAGALSLYIDFINIFISLMNLMGNRR